jgi:hypothetical protein
MFRIVGRVDKCLCSRRYSSGYKVFRGPSGEPGSRDRQPAIVAANGSAVKRAVSALSGEPAGLSPSSDQTHTAIGQLDRP